MARSIHDVERREHENLQERYDAALQRDFRGISIDLDGTALNENGEITPEALRLLLYLLRCRVPLIVNTGRGVGSTQEKIEERIPPHLRHNLVVANYNGGIVRRFEGEREYILAEFKLKQSHELFDALTTSPDSPVKDDLILGGEGFSSKRRDIAITLAFKPGANIDRNAVLAFLEKKGYLGEVEVLFSGHSIDIISAKGGKAAAVNVVAESFGFQPSDIVRVGDQGQEGGNDYSMLSSPSGFSVGKRDEQNAYGCHPVVDEDGEVMTGIAAFQKLLFDISWQSGVVVDKSNFFQSIERNAYSQEYHKLSDTARKNFEQRSKTFEKQILQGNEVMGPGALHAFEAEEGALRSVFSFNGAVRFSESDLESINTNSPLSTFLFTESEKFGKTKKPFYKYLVSYGKNPEFYGRAESFYISMQETGEENIERIARGRLLHLVGELKDIWQFLPLFQETVEKGGLSKAEWKTVVMFFDHLRYYSIQLFHAISYLRTIHALPQDGFSDSLYHALRDFAEWSNNAFYDSVEMKKAHFQNTFSLELLGEATKHLLSGIDNEQVPAKKRAKAMRGVSEADHPYFNLMYGKIAARNILPKLHEDKPVVLAGMHYGGVELPFLVKRELQRISKLDPELLSLHFSKYSNVALESESDMDLESLSDTPGAVVDGKTVVIMDDGVFSGGSLYQTGLVLTYEGADVLFSTQGIANSRRLGQMQEAGGVHPDFVRQELLSDIIRVSPFSRAQNLAEYREQKAGSRFNLVKRRIKQMMSKGYPSSEVKGGKADAFSRIRLRP